MNAIIIFALIAAAFVLATLISRRRRIGAALCFETGPGYRGRFESIAAWPKGKARDFDSRSAGSSPAAAAILHLIYLIGRDSKIRARTCAYLGGLLNV